MATNNCGKTNRMTRHNILNLPVQVASPCIQLFCFQVRFAVLYLNAFGCFAFGCVYLFRIWMHSIILLADVFNCFASRCIQCFAFRCVQLIRCSPNEITSCEKKSASASYHDRHRKENDHSLPVLSITLAHRSNDERRMHN